MAIRPSDGDVSPGGHFANFLSVGSNKIHELSGWALNIRYILFSYQLRQVLNVIFILGTAIVKDGVAELQ